MSRVTYHWLKGDKYGTAKKDPRVDQQCISVILWFVFSCEETRVAPGARFFRLAAPAPSCSIIRNAGLYGISLIGRVSGVKS